MGEIIGRPSKYDDETVKKTLNYIKNHADFGDVVPNVAGLCCELGITKVTAYDWSSQDEKADFSYTLDLLQQKQERLLLSGGLSGNTNSAITKLMLCNHGYSDKPQDDHNNEVDALIKAFAALSGKVPV